MEKKDKQHAIRITSSLYRIARDFMAKRSIGSFSEYVRGLILIDLASQSYDLIRGRDLPGWVTNDRRYIELTRQANNPRPRPSQPQPELDAAGSDELGSRQA